MKAEKVLQMLGITRRTLTTYVKQKKIRVVKLNNGFYNYDDDDVKSLTINRKSQSNIIINLDKKRMIFEFDKKIVQEILDLCMSKMI